jgi:ZIP family zinc transporter
MTSVLWSLIAGLGTTVGGLIVVALGQPRRRLLGALLGFAGGVMVGVVAVDLIPSSLSIGNIWTCLAGGAAGLLLMRTLEAVVPAPAINLWQRQVGTQVYRRMGYLIAAGIALHNMPEGLAIGAGFASDEALGFAVALAIGLHDVPEGMGVAAPLTMGGVGAGPVIWLTTLAGLCTPIGALIGQALFRISPTFIAGGLALAAGAMADIVRVEVWPEAYAQSKRGAVYGFLLGCAAACALPFIT